MFVLFLWFVLGHFSGFFCVCLLLSLIVEALHFLVSVESWFAI